MQWLVDDNDADSSVKVNLGGHQHSAKKILKLKTENKWGYPHTL